MKFLLSLLAALALLPSLRAEDRIEITTRFIEAGAGLDLPHDLAALNRMKGVDLLSAPRVTTKPGQKVEVSIEQELKPPAGGFIDAEDKPLTGFRFQAVGSFQGDDIAYRLHLTRCKIATVASDSTSERTVSHDLYANGTAKDDETIWLTFGDLSEGKQHFVLVTFTRHKG